jgi:hypothetical protein
MTLASLLRTNRAPAMSLRVTFATSSREVVCVLQGVRDGLGDCGGDSWASCLLHPRLRDAWDAWDEEQSPAVPARVPENSRLEPE